MPARSGIFLWDGASRLGDLRCTADLDSQAPCDPSTAHLCHTDLVTMSLTHAVFALRVISQYQSIQVNHDCWDLSKSCFEVLGPSF